MSEDDREKLYKRLLKRVKSHPVQEKVLRTFQEWIEAERRFKADGYGLGMAIFMLTLFFSSEDERAAYIFAQAEHRLKELSRG
jgi:hypothetical protein